MTSHNGEPAFADDEEYRYWLTNLRLLRHEFGVALYAFCVLPASTLLILNPGPDPARLGLVMKRLAGRQTGYVNARRGRRGTLWCGRYRSSPIEPEKYLLACCRYMELAPVRVGLAAAPEDYPWSSCQDRLAGESNHWIDTHAAWQALGDSESQRAERYMSYIHAGIPPKEHQFIEGALRRGQLTGDAKFVDYVERLTGRRIETRGRGRPKGAPTHAPAPAILGQQAGSANPRASNLILAVLTDGDKGYRLPLALPRFDALSSDVSEPTALSDNSAARKEPAAERTPRPAARM